MARRLLNSSRQATGPRREASGPEEIHELVDPYLEHYGATASIEVDDDESDYGGAYRLGFSITLPLRGRTVGDAYELGKGLLALVKAAEDGEATGGVWQASPRFGPAVGSRTLACASVRGCHLSICRVKWVADDRVRTAAPTERVMFSVDVTGAETFA
jgi:hypothetical protein